MTLKRASLTVAIIAPLTLGLTGCEPSKGVTVVNKTQQTLEVQELGADGYLTMKTLNPDSAESLLLRTTVEGCTDKAGVRAIDSADGSTVATLEKVCPGDTWTIK